VRVQQVGGRKGWRLPSVHEIASLVDPAKVNPALPTGHPFTNVQSSAYWSATTSAGSANDKWCMSFSSGTPFEGLFGAFNGTQFVWCVRSSQGHGDVY